jgi:NitT/TauT family transport system permease protein
VVVLGNIGLTGLLPKALIAGYLSFFPITTGMVKGLRSPDPMQHDLMRTYSASGAQVFRKLRWPAAMGFLFPSLKVAATLALVGAIVAELPTGAQAGLGARLLTGSYYGQTQQIWAALIMASLLALLAVGAIDAARLTLLRARGGRL